MFSETGRLFVPVLDKVIATDVYKNRSNGYADNKNNTKLAILEGELCLDTLIAIYSLMIQDITI